MATHPTASQPVPPGPVDAHVDERVNPPAPDGRGDGAGSLPLKHCPRCGHSKPLSAFYTRRNGRPSGYCRDCQRSASRANYERRCQDPAQLAHIRALDRQRKQRSRVRRGSGVAS